MLVVPASWCRRPSRVVGGVAAATRASRGGEASRAALKGGERRVVLAVCRLCVGLEVTFFEMWQKVMMENKMEDDRNVLDMLYMLMMCWCCADLLTI